MSRVPNFCQPEILFENSDIIVLNKPFGWHSVGPDKSSPSLENWLKNLRPELGYNLIASFITGHDSRFDEHRNSLHDIPKIIH